MNLAAIQHLRTKLEADQAVHGLWITLESTAVSEMAVALGLDWMVIDAEHGQLDWQEIAAHVRSAVRSRTVVLVRVTELNGGLIKRALDLGADGVVIPWVESPEQLAEAVRCAKYPPEGKRGIGAERATGWGECFAEHAGQANEHVLVVPLIESVAGGEAIEALTMVEGADAFFLGPADYSATAGHRGRWEGPGVAETLLKIKETVRAAGKPCGIMATSPEELVGRRLQGFRMLAVGSDAGLFLRGLHAVLGPAGIDRTLRSSMVPEDRPLPVTRLSRPPAMLRPDREEAIAEPGKRAPVELAEGVRFDPLVTAGLGARGLTTGLVTFDPEAELLWHVHPFGEAITVLEGCLSVTVEGRRYELEALDTIVIPAQLPHAAWNRDAAQPARVHAAMPTDQPVREVVEGSFEIQPMPPDSQGVPGKEFVVRFATAPRTEPGPGASFIDHFNHDLVPGIGMSGGYGRFQPGGRLPAHVHDFDESICITEGEATCVVEGRRYAMADCATALQPRGRVHYFINESDHPMAMIWVYAGPYPERIVVDEACATPEGNPWRE